MDEAIHRASRLPALSMTIYQITICLKISLKLNQKTAYIIQFYTNFRSESILKYSSCFIGNYSVL